MSPNNNIKRSTFVVRMPNGKYIEKWQYSQGNFDYRETDDIFHACLIDKEQYETFFKDENATWLAVDFTATFK